ncbi:nucleoside triphosphate pyrophosphohydrolase family protein [Erythrobacter aureus]|uniref:Pyrophosphatase n=1 Tax=Erythrobacter aureus TaxID=2182384 RepID=A0A345YFQ7_9SPHN|nr:nucleoside triphosphate pyrophosphohydrolase family protein [Erythrobacter aureus]AXK42759.1 pyrophosphatase [Erythrobacter aureus]
MSENSDSGTFLLADYIQKIAATDGMKSDIRPVLFGLFGEVGGIMATAKKHHREGNAYYGYQLAVEEEFGDTLWYLAAVCRRVEINLEEIFAEVISGTGYTSVIAASDLTTGSISRIISPKVVRAIDDALLSLGQAAANLLVIGEEANDPKPLLVDFVDHYLKALEVAQLSFAQIARSNLKKTVGRFVAPNSAHLPMFDSGFLEEEQLPEKFEIEIRERATGRSYLRWNNVFIGDPLTDNIGDPDGYRFHDVFHFAHAAILHWSPVMRALIKQKRKSVPDFDEAQDSGRAIVVEEGLTAWIFSRAKDLEFFEGQDRVSFDMLKTVEGFVRGYEVQECPLSLWERAILDGYAVFRKVRKNGGGVVVGDRANRTIEYKPLAKGDADEPSGIH